MRNEKVLEINFYIYNTSLSYVTELFSLFTNTNLVFLLIPLKIHLKVFPFAFNIAISIKNKLPQTNHDIY